MGCRAELKINTQTQIDLSYRRSITREWSLADVSQRDRDVPILSSTTCPWSLLPPCRAPNWPQDPVLQEPRTKRTKLVSRVTSLASLLPPVKTTPLKRIGQTLQVRPAVFSMMASRGRLWGRWSCAEALQWSKDPETTNKTSGRKKQFFVSG